ncbi:related to nop6-protein with possible role in rrna processing [Ceraceosorus bombacis]|uniref:Related to nop6-protein with possible role in rrna processing n=1 Tax=Ceraceosorus bombacis TaxID=401625 RepID=A0A0P1BI09_9BASI|nr:related to nop6-protein with possible role in rrna processing [Ceraceosorus bombacis]
MPAGATRKARRAQEGKTLPPGHYVDASSTPQSSTHDIGGASKLVIAQSDSQVSIEPESGTSTETTPAVKPLKKKAIKAMLAKGIAPPDMPSASISTAKVAKAVRLDSSDQGAESKKGGKRKRGEDGAENEENDAGGEDKAAKSEAKRYIVFVGNMSFTSTASSLASHFKTHCHEEPKVRLLTTKYDTSAALKLSKSKQKSISKGKALDPGASKSKGCAFVEFENTSALQKALQFHHTLFEGRLINVELTAGGGGAGTKREEKIKAKNQALEKERQKLHEKYVAPKSESKKAAGGDSTVSERPPKRAKPEDDNPTSGEGAAQWGSRAKGGASEERQKRGGRRGKNAQANAGGDKGKGPGKSKPPRWAVTGANALKLQG